MKNEHNWFEWQYQRVKIIKDHTGKLGFQYVAVDSINGVAALTGFS